MRKQWITEGQLCNYTGLSRYTVRQLRKLPSLQKAVKTVLSSVFYDEDAWLASEEVNLLINKKKERKCKKIQPGQ